MSTRMSPAGRLCQHFVAVVVSLLLLGCSAATGQHYASPEIELRPGESGRVVVRALIDATGRAVQVELESSSGNPRLDEAALAVVPKWKLIPAQQDGRPVASWTLIPFEFRGDDAR